MGLICNLLCIVFLLPFLAFSANGDAGSYGVFNVNSFGAKAGDMVDSSKGFLDAWREACNHEGLAKVLVPSETYLVTLATFEGPCKGPIVFELQGLVLAAKGLPSLDDESWITFQRIVNLTITGGGTFHGQGATAWAENHCVQSSKCKILPVSLRFNFVNDSTIEHIQSIDSKFFHITIMGCYNLKLQSLNISAPADSPNTDGIHILRSNGVEITNSVIGTGDDCISLGENSRNVNISKIFCGPGHGISVGSLGKKAKGENVEGLTVRNCTFVETDNGVRIKTWPSSTGDGIASNFTFDDLVMDNVRTAIVIDQQYCPYASCKPEGFSRVKISDVSFTNIRGTTTRNVSVSLICSEGFPCRNISVGDIHLLYNGVEEDSSSSICANVEPVFHGKQMPAICV